MQCNPGSQSGVSAAATADWSRDGRDRMKADEEDEAFRAAVRRTAYFLWEQDGRPEGRQEALYLRALDMHRRARTYDGWLEDRPAGD